MALKKCAACGAEVEETQLFLSDRGEICAACEIEEQTASHEALEGGLAHPAVIIGLLVGIIPFFVSITNASTLAENGNVSSSYLDYVAVAGGGVGALAGVAFLGVSLRANQNRLLKLGVAAAILALGAVHLLRGFGVI